MNGWAVITLLTSIMVAAIMFGNPNCNINITLRITDPIPFKEY